VSLDKDDVAALKQRAKESYGENLSAAFAEAARWIAGLAQLKPLSTLELRLLPLDFVMHWHRCGPAADYFAAHLAYTFDNRENAYEQVFGPA
jgi:hypothetical protein